MKAIAIHTSGQIEEIDKEWSLEALQQHVGGYIEVLPTPWPATVMIVNEEGKSAPLLRNTGATQILGRFLAPNDYVVGEVLLVGKGRSEFTDAPISIHQVKEFM